MIAIWFEEDIRDGDHTSLSCIPPTQMGCQQLIIKDSGVLAGVEVAKEIIAYFDPACRVEQYLHDDPAADASDEMSFGLLKTVHKWAPAAVAEPANMDARSNLLWCAILAMSRVLGVGHEENWLGHMLEHAVSAKYNLAHAAGMAAIMPAYLDFLEKKGQIPEKLGRLAELLGGETAGEGLRAFQKSLGLPVNLTEALGHGATEEEISEMAQHSLPWGPMEAACLGEFSQKDAETIFRNSFSE